LINVKSFYEEKKIEIRETIIVKGCGQFIHFVWIFRSPQCHLHSAAYGICFLRRFLPEIFIRKIDLFSHKLCYNLTGILLTKNFDFLNNKNLPIAAGFSINICVAEKTVFVYK